MVHAVLFESVPVLLADYLRQHAGLWITIKISFVEERDIRSQSSESEQRQGGQWGLFSTMAYLRSYQSSRDGDLLVKASNHLPYTNRTTSSCFCGSIRVIWHWAEHTVGMRMLAFPAKMPLVQSWRNCNP